MSFTDRIALVTGAASGMGRELVRQLAAQGAQVVATDIDSGALDRALAQDHAGSPRVRGEQLDVVDGVRFRQLIERTARDHGRLDYLFNNAGIAIWGDARDMTRAQWEKIININLWGVLNGTTVAYELMCRQGSGHIVNTASAAGLAPIPMMTAYATTKHAVVGLSTSLRAEGADLGVKVSVVCPGVINTSIFDHATGLGIDIPRVRKTMPLRELPVDKAVQEILAGVARNEGVIIFPASARALDRFIRLRRGGHEPLWNRAVRHLRALNEKKENA